MKHTHDCKHVTDTDVFDEVQNSLNGRTSPMEIWVTADTDFLVVVTNNLDRAVPYAVGILHRKSRNWISVVPCRDFREIGFASKVLLDGASRLESDAFNFTNDQGAN